MGAAREWLTSIVVVTVMLSVAQMLLPEGTLRKVGSFTGGLILLVVMLRPLLGLEVQQLELDLDTYSQAVEERQEELETAGNRELAGLIESRTAAYISEQAQRMGIETEVWVRTKPGEQGVPVPVEVALSGERIALLEEWIAETIGIPAERQVWSNEG